METAKQDAIEIRAEAPNPMRLLELAVSQNLDLDKLKQLMDLQERWERNEARKAFVVAMNEFKKAPPTILKNKQVSFGKGDSATKYNHATLDGVCEAVTKALSEHGISHRWQVQQEQSAIRVTCILTHDMGHSEETTLVGGPDTSGSKNAIQAIGSTVTYLQRYTLLAATGLAAEDDDGRSASKLSNGELGEQLEELERCETLAGLEDAFKAAATKALDHAKDINAYHALKQAKNKRKQELTNANR
jgi:hypothetical protein